MNPDIPNSIIQGDCIDVLKSFPSDSIDVAFADPPFNLNKGYRSTNDALKTQKYLEWCEQWLIELVRLTKPGGSVFVHNIPKWLTHFSAILNPIADFKHWIAWDAATNPMGKTLQPAHYGILCYSKKSGKQKFYEIRHPHKRCRKCGYLMKDYGGKKRLLHPFGPLLSDIWTDIHRIRHKKYRDDHPCQLPVHLLERIILMSSDEGDVVLDPFLGTGTTAIAAKKLGRKYIGIELDEEYVRVSRSKVDETASDSKLGEAWVSFFLNEPITIRNIDWEILKKHFAIPSPAEAVDYCKCMARGSIHKRKTVNNKLVQQEKLEFEKELESLAGSQHKNS